MPYDSVSSVMSRNRFETAIRNAHFVDKISITEDDERQDRLWKLKAWISILCNKIFQVTPEEYHSVHEIKVPFKEQSIMRKYMPN